MKSVGWFVLAGLAAVVALPFGWSAAYIAWFSGECTQWVPFQCGQQQTFVFMVAAMGAVGAWHRGTAAVRAQRGATTPEPGVPSPRSHEGVVESDRSQSVADDSGPGAIWRIAGEAFAFIAPDDGSDPMWLAKVTSGTGRKWSLQIDRAVGRDETGQDDFCEFGMWRSEARAFAAADETKRRFDRGEYEYRFEDDFGRVIEVNPDDTFGADWTVAAPLLPREPP